MKSYMSPQITVCYQVDNMLDMYSQVQNRTAEESEQLSRSIELFEDEEDTNLSESIWDEKEWNNGL